jgi:hypothetical protein
MTTTTATTPATSTTPTFRVRGRLATLRGILIVSGCLALGSFFVVQSWSGPSTTSPARQAEVRS